MIRPTRPTSRGLSAFEFLLGAGIVLGYNVFKVLPNEVPILVVLGLLSARLRNGGLSALGFRRPDSWSRIVWIALAAAAARIVLGEFVVDPITTQFWPPTELPPEAEEITGNLPYALLFPLNNPLRLSSHRLVCGVFHRFLSTSSAPNPSAPPLLRVSAGESGSSNSN